MDTASVKRPHKTIVIASVIVVAILGGIAYAFVLLRQSQQPVTAVEVEQTATTGDGVVVGEDAEASGGKYIQFEQKQ